MTFTAKVKLIFYFNINLHFQAVKFKSRDEYEKR